MSLSNYPLQAWYPAGWSSEVEGDAILKRKFFGKDIVFFRGDGGELVGLDAMCPHRGADLSLGSVQHGCIQCPFHGWRFNVDGKCVAIPSQSPAGKIPKKAELTKYFVRESQGIIWLWPGEGKPEVELPPKYEWLEESYGRGMRRVQDIPMLVKGPFISVLENAIDNTHPPFIHPGTLAGEPEIVVDQKIVFDSDMKGFWGQLDSEDKTHDEVTGTEGVLGISRRILGVTKLDRKNCYFRYDLGGVVYFYDKFESGHDQVALFMAAPADDTHAWFFCEHIRSFAKVSIVDWAIKKWLRQLNGEDVNHVELMISSKFTHGVSNPVSVSADAPALAFRRVFFRNLNKEHSRSNDANELSFEKEAV